MFVKDLYLAYFCVISATVTAQLGNKCTVKITNSPGICKLGSDCSVVEEEASQGIDPTLCGFHELIRPIVCCPTNDFRPNQDDDKNVLVQSFLIPDKDHQRLSEKSSVLLQRNNVFAEVSTHGPVCDFGIMIALQIQELRPF